MDKVAMTRLVKQLLKNPGNAYLQKAIKGVVEAKRNVGGVLKGVYSGPKAFLKEHALELGNSRAAHPEFARPFASFTALSGKGSGSFPLHQKELMNDITLSNYGIRA